MEWPFGDLTPFSFRLIMADPAWLFRNYSVKGEAKNPLAHYACMDIEAIKALPVGHLAAPDCVLLLWAIAPMLPEAIDTMKAWGFTFKSAGAWAKQSSTGRKWAFGPGYWLRSAAEFWLLGTIGKPAVLDHSIRNLIVAPVREHSRKPDEMIEIAERIAHGPRVELFARTTRPGWSSWGNQTDKFEA